MSDESPKIIVDEDWKSQVEKEKQQAAQATASGEVADADPASTADDTVAQRTPPPASLESLVSMLFSQTLAALGQFPLDDDQEPTVDKPLAKYFIDTLELLGEKTKGNLSDEESKLIADTLHGLRMTYVSVKATK